MRRKKKGLTDVGAETIAKLNEATDGVLGREAQTAPDGDSGGPLDELVRKVVGEPAVEPAGEWARRVACPACDAPIDLRRPNDGEQFAFDPDGTPHTCEPAAVKAAGEWKEAEVLALIAGLPKGDDAFVPDEDAADPDPRLIARIRTGRPCPREASGALCALSDCADECVIVRGEQAKAELDADHTDDSDPFGFRALARHEGEAHLHLHAIRAYLDAANAMPPGEDDAVPEWDLLAQEDRDRLLKLYRRQAVAFDGFDLDPDGDADTPDAATALAVYQSIVTGKVKIAQWKGRALVSATGETIGSVLLTPNGYGARYGRREREDDAPEDVCRVWVETAASTDGWKVLS